MLDDVLGLGLIAEHVAAERQHRPVIALVERLEGGRVAGSDERDQTRVSGHPHQPRMHEDARRRPVPPAAPR